VFILIGFLVLGCTYTDKEGRKRTVRWAPGSSVQTSSSITQSTASTSSGQSRTAQNTAPTTVGQSRTSGENPTVTIIDEFHNDSVEAVQKYQEFHPIDFFAATMSVSGGNVVLSYEGNTTAKEQWAKNPNFQGWSAWYQNTQNSPSYHVTCNMPVSELSKFPELSGSKQGRIRVNAKLIDYSPGSINLQCKK
jgi:hypothetical protein